MVRGLWLTSAAVGAALLAQAASAQQPSQAQASAIRQSCRGDSQAHCAGVPTGGAAALGCLQQNAASLSPACQRAVGAVGHGSAAAAPASPQAAAPGAMREQCGPDVRRLCRGVPLGGGRVLECLADNRESLSPGCREALAALRERR